MTRSEQRAETRQRILTIARDLFSRQDYDAVTVRLIARCAGVSTGAIFAIWADKGALHVDAMGYDYEALARVAPRLYAALERVESWTFPPSGRFWNNDDGTLSDRPMSYGAAYGSNGERDFMRAIAADALDLVRVKTDADAPATTLPEGAFR